MAARKRKKLQRESDLAIIAELYLQGWQQSDIAARIGITQPQVSYDLKVIQKRWREDTAINMDEARNRELTRIDMLEREYWDAWARSKEEKTKTRQEAKGKDESGRPIVTRLTGEKEQMIGNPQYLAGVQWCISERCKLLGIYAPEQRKHSGSIAIKGYTVVSPDDWDDADDSDV